MSGCCIHYGVDLTKPDKPQAKVTCCNRLMGGGGIREDGEVLSRICLHRLTRACYEQRNVCCVHLEHAPFCTENKPACTLTAAVADSSYIQESGHQLSSLLLPALSHFSAFRWMPWHLQTDHARFFTNSSKLAAHMVFFSLSMPSRAAKYSYPRAISILTIVMGPRKNNSVVLLTSEIHTHTKAYGLSICCYVPWDVNWHEQGHQAAVTGTYASVRIQVPNYARKKKKILCS
jgi:hypothetical protein